MISKKEIPKKFQENLIGKKAKIQTKTKTFEGKIILETKNTIKIQTNNKEITILKKDAQITINQEKINGKTITKRTEERIKQRG